MLRITDLAGITVLLVDDDQDSVEILAMFLGVCGATVRAAALKDSPTSIRSRASTCS